MNRTAVQKIEQLFESERRRLWGIAYRMTGTAADADDVVQETFTRALTHPPAGGGDDEAAWRPWLARIAVNLARDAYRRRQRRAYVGPWLPGAVETGPDSPLELDGLPGHDRPDARYDRLESVTFAFLLALEALTPRQRAVLLLRDVFDYSVHETAEALELSDANVKVTHHRARAVMAGYDRARCRPDEKRRTRTAAALERLMIALGGDDVAAVERLLAADVRSLNDGGGEFRAALRPVLGRARVARLYWRLGRRRPPVAGEIRLINGLPALILRVAPGTPRDADCAILIIDVDEEEQIVAVNTIAASAKLRAVRI
jgi:RNA polymerase sigma-70 factor (ECF subfamily)